MVANNKADFINRIIDLLEIKSRIAVAIQNGGLDVSLVG